MRRRGELDTRLLGWNDLSCLIRPIMVVESIAGTIIPPPSMASSGSCTPAPPGEMPRNVMGPGRPPPIASIAGGLAGLGPAW